MPRALFILLSGLTIILAGCDNVAPTPGAVEVAPTETLLPPTDTPLPVATLSPTDTLRAAITGALDDSDRGVERITKLEITPVAILIEWTVNGRYGADLAKYDARADTVAILKVIHELNRPYDFIVLTGMFGDAMAMRLNYERETLDAIDWQDARFVVDSLPFTIYDLADEGVVNPAFESLD